MNIRGASTAEHCIVVYEIETCWLNIDFQVLNRLEVVYVWFYGPNVYYLEVGMQTETWSFPPRSRIFFESRAEVPHLRLDATEEVRGRLLRFPVDEGHVPKFGSNADWGRNFVLTV